MELFGPKKRGPKPKTFLLKVRWEHCREWGADCPRSLCGMFFVGWLHAVGCGWASGR